MRAAVLRCTRLIWAARCLMKDTGLLSTAGGLSFLPSDTGLPKNSPVNVVAFKPGSTSVMFAGTALGLYRSPDAGTTWTCVSCSGSISSFHDATALAFSPANANTLLVGIDQWLFKSTDGGTTWTAITSFGSDPYARTRAISYADSSGGVVYAGYAELYSPNAG